MGAILGLIFIVLAGLGSLIYFHFADKKSSSNMEVA